MGRRIKFDKTFDKTQFVIGVLQFVVSLVLCLYVSPVLGVFVAMVRVEV